MSFSKLEARINRACTARLANASAMWTGQDGAQPVGGLRVVFDQATSGRLDGLVNTTDPVAAGFAGDFSGVRRGDSLVITPDLTGIALGFDVVRASPDGTGLVVLDLREVAP